MINLAVHDIRYSWWRYSLTGMVLGLLIAATMTLFGIYRGMIADALSLPADTGADIWVVQENTLGPYAEASSLYADEYRGLAGFPGVEQAANIVNFSLQVQHNNQDVRAVITGYEEGKMGQPSAIIAGRPVQSRYEAVVDKKSGFMIGESIDIRNRTYTVVGLTEHMVSTAGDPAIFVWLRDAQQIQSKKDNTSVYNDRKRQNASEDTNKIAKYKTNAVAIKVAPGWDIQQVADSIKQWKHFEAYTYSDMKHFLLSKIIEKAAKQIAFFLVILEIVSAAIVALLIYTMTMSKLKEIAVLKLIGAGNLLITMMILQEAWGIGVIGYCIGSVVSVLWVPIFPRYIVYSTDIRLLTLALTLSICTLASVISIRAAMKVEPSAAIGG